MYLECMFVTFSVRAFKYDKPNLTSPPSHEPRSMTCTDYCPLTDVYPSLTFLFVFLLFSLLFTIFYCKVTVSTSIRKWDLILKGEVTPGSPPMIKSVEMDVNTGCESFLWSHMIIINTVLYVSACPPSLSCLPLNLSLPSVFGTITEERSDCVRSCFHRLAAER